jgi:EAL domain-containing protein (putative c-di-GMP-specific phosphodiesterase class I)
VSIVAVPEIRYIGSSAVVATANPQANARFSTALAGMRRAGLRLAVDDAGAGFASLRHILKLAPDMIKLDGSLTRNIDTDPKSRALGAAFSSFAREVGAIVVGEGVERRSQLAALREVGVSHAQGYLLGRPHPPLAEALTHCSS